MYLTSYHKNIAFPVHIHHVKPRNLTKFPAVEILRKCTVSAQKIARNSVETVTFCNISTPGNQVKIRYFTQLYFALSLYKILKVRCVEQPVFSRIWTQSFILSLYWKIRARENLFSAYFVQRYTQQSHVSLRISINWPENSRNLSNFYSK